MRFLKYILISVFSVVLFSVFAFAAEDVVATVNGEGFSSVSAALAASSSGDRVELVSDDSFSGSLVVPAGVNFFINPGTTLSTVDGNISSPGNMFVYGSAIRTGSESSSGTFIILSGSGSSEFYGQVLSSSNRGNVVSTSSNASLIVYSGDYSGHTFALYAGNDNLTVMGGSFSSVENPSSPNSSRVVYGPGVSSFLEGGKLISSWGPLYQIGQIVSSAISWIGLICAAIISNKLLLIFVILIFVGVGVGLIKIFS